VEEAFGVALRQKKPVFITVTSARHGTQVYLDGGLAKLAAPFWIPEEALRGRLIVGDSPLQPDSFRGQIRGVAIYDVELNAAQAWWHYRTWREKGRPDLAPGEGCSALYLFDEHAGKTIRNQATGAAGLFIPETYTVVDKISMQPFWKEFDFSRGYWSGNLKNIVGFIPAGFCFYAYFVVARRMRRAVLVTVVAGALVSLTIESLQAFLPTRDSGTTDIITNAMGTYVGVWCYRHIYVELARRFPALGWLAVPPPAASY